MATPGRPRRPPKSANTLLCGKGLHSHRKRLRCDVQEACDVPGARGKVRSAQTKVWPLFVRGAGPVSRTREETPSPP